jgi:hypothetical protein
VAHARPKGGKGAYAASSPSAFGPKIMIRFFTVSVICPILVNSSD